MRYLTNISRSEPTFLDNYAVFTCTKTNLTDDFIYFFCLLIKNIGISDLGTINYKQLIKFLFQQQFIIMDSFGICIDILISLVKQDESLSEYLSSLILPFIKTRNPFIINRIFIFLTKLYIELREHPLLLDFQIIDEMILIEIL